MSDKKSWKHSLGNFFQATKPTLAPASDSLYSHSVASSNTCDADSTSSIWSSSPASGKPNFEGITLIWYDPRVGKTEDTKLTAEELREINDCVIVYSDQVDCAKYMKSVENEKIFLITSGKAATSIIPEIQQLKQVEAIFIFCLTVEKYQYLLQKYDSIVGIYCKRSTLIDSIKQNVELLQKQLNAFSFYNEHEEKATRDISKESAEFLWFQLFKDVLLQMPRNDQAKQELIDFSRQYYRGNQKEYRNIIEFEKSYELKKSIYWYTKDSFLYRLVNKALRTEDVGQLHIFRFFISDLSSKLAEIHTKQNRKQKNTVMLYRGLKLEIDELKRLKQNIGCIISANGFLSTSHSQDVAIKFATQPTKRTNIAPVLYEIECNLNALESVVFGDITKYSEFAQEQEVLFDLGSTFKIESISENEQLKMVLVKLIATDAGKKMAQKYIELNRKMNEETTPDILFGILLVEMGKYDQSLSYFRNLLNTSNGKVDIARVHSAMGSVYLCKGELDEAYKCADRAYQMMIRVKPSRIKDSTRPMTVMAHVYLRRKMYEKSLDLYFEALEIREKFYGQKHLDTAVVLNHIGNVYYKMEEYSQALRFYKKSFKIREKKLPHIHLDTAASLNNLGLIHWKGREKLTHGEMVSNFEALEYFQESLNIRKQVLPSDHNDIIQSLDNITRLLYESHDIDGSLKYFIEALTVQKIDFNPSDRDNLLSRLEEQFGPRLHIELKISDWPEYAQTYVKCCDIDDKETFIAYNEEVRTLMKAEEERIELRKQEDFSILENFIKTVDSGGDYSMTLEAVTKTLKTSPRNFIYFSSYNHIEYLMTRLYDLVQNAYDSTDESNKALRFYEKVQFILDSAISLWANTSDIQIICLERIGHIHQLNDKYESALESLEQSLKIQRDNKNSSNDIPDKLRCIGLIHMTLGSYKSALISFNDALELLQSNPTENDREIKLILKRIHQATEGLKSTTDSLE